MKLVTSLVNIGKRKWKDGNREVGKAEGKMGNA